MELTARKIAEIIEAFISDTGGEWDWDDFVSVRLKNKKLEEVRKKCAELPQKYPPKEKGQYCCDEGVDILRNIVIELRESQSERAV